jgi:alpha,alpha-trehalase
MRIAVQETLDQLLAQEDTDGDKKITIEDRGPGNFVLKDLDDKQLEVKGTYHLANLLQELVLARVDKDGVGEIDPGLIEEPPVKRISRMIRQYYWNGLTRTMDREGVAALISDSKNDTLQSDRLIVYVPHGDHRAYDYYMALTSTLPIEVVRLPEQITPEFVSTINDKPGILSLDLEESPTGLKGKPFVVPGGRFNEMYGWDSYFESIGLLLDQRVDLAQAMADHFRYQIIHYGKILNANRSYYLTRTQPPFYSSLVREVFEKNDDRNWLKTHLASCILEYETVWMQKGKRLTPLGLNRYLAEGIGMPPEAEAGHFDHVFGPEAEKAGIPLAQYESLYFKRELTNPALDNYFVHDRSVRESGHDTSYRLEGVCADIIPVELNAFLYKYETDLEFLIRTQFGGKLTVEGKSYTADYWQAQAQSRKERINQLLWNGEKGLYFDFNLKSQSMTDFVSATTLTPLWAGICSPAQASILVRSALELLKEKGGVVSCTEKSRGPVGKERPQKQWDYPNGWAPHQMMIWKGLKDYRFNKELQELVYRWLYMITRNAVDYNGTIPEKYDVVSATHKVFAEYGNVGTEFSYITREGFGWMNASFQYGISLLDDALIEELNKLTSPEVLFTD